MPLGFEPGGRPVPGGVFVAVPPDRDGKSKQRPPGEEPSLPTVDAPDRRFDVAIEIFELAHDHVAGSGEELPSSLLRPEARYLSLELRRTLEDSGHWGTVRVVPASGEGFDIVVSGRVVHSSRERLELEVEARNALGHRLVPRNHRGEGEAALPEVMGGIAADLVRWRDEGPKANLSAVRAAALLHFGAQLAPEIFGRYRADPRGAEPAPDPQDSLVQRLQRISDRDQTFLTILNRHYTELHLAMTAAYGDWRAGSSPALQWAALATLEVVVRSFDAPGPPSVVKAEGYEKTLAGSVESQFLAWRRLARRALHVESAFVR